jgi:hypothetical protein
MSDIPNFAKLVPGFDFLQGLVKNAGSALPSMGQWVAPTLNPDELQKRIDELKTVQFWLEQNAKMLGTTIQALEVQRMTLSTLKTMNVQMTDLRDAMKVAPAASAGSAASAAVGSMASSFGADALMQAAKNAMGGIAGLGKAPPPAREAAPEPAPAPPAQAAGEPPAVTASGVVDPMQWWGALTKQFTQLAAGAMKDSATDAAQNIAGAMMKQGLDAAGETIRNAVVVPAGVAAKAMSAATRAAGATGAKAAARNAAAAKKPAARKSPARKSAAKTAKPRAR